MAVLLVACGGPAPRTLSITPASIELLPGESREFSAAGTYSDAGKISWSASGGSITGSGSLVTYTAPGNLGAYRVSAVLASSPPSTASAEVEVVAELDPPTDPTSDPLADERYITIVGQSDFTPPVEPLFVGGFGPNVGIGLQALVDGVPWASQVPPYSIGTSANCGPASFLILEAFHRGTSLTREGTDPKIREVVDWLDANVAGYVTPHKPGIEYYNGGNTSAWILEPLARSRGFANALPASASSMEILKQHLAQNQPVIVRVHWQRGAHTGNEMVETNFGHYAVVVGMDSQYVYLNDPGVRWEQQRSSPGLNYGEYRRYTIDSFRRVWEAGPGGLRNVALFVPVSGTARPVGIDARSLALPQARLNAPYAAQLAGSGGRDPYTWSVFRGGLPAGLSLTANGRIEGTPVTSGTYDFWVRLQDSAGSVAEAEATMTVAASVEAASLAIHSAPLLPLAQVGSAYLVSMSASGGSAPYRWSIASGTLPPGLTLSQDGAVRGTPTSEGEHAFAVRLLDSSGSPQVVERRFTLSVMPASGEDLPAAGADLIASGLSVTPSAAAAGANVTVAFHVENVGDSPARSSTVRVRINDDPTNVTTSDPLLAELGTTALAAGQSQAYTRTVSLPSGLADGTHYVWVTADVFNAVDQSNDQNDRATVPLDIESRSDCAGQPISIPDARLRDAIVDTLEVLGWRGSVVDCEAMAWLPVLDGYGYGISNLAGLEHAVNATDINLADNQINDLEPLGRLDRLAILILSGNDIEDLEPLSNLDNLVQVFLDDNRIDDLAGFGRHQDLRYLYLSNNDIQNVEGLVSLESIESLDLDYNSVSDLEPLSGLRTLTGVSLAYNAITDIGPLENLENLTGLNLTGNAIVDIGAVQDLDRLEYLDLAEMRLVDLSALQDLTNLRSLILHDNRILDIVPLVLNTGLGRGDQIDLSHNCLDLAEGSTASLSIDILEGRGAAVVYLPQSDCD